MEEKFLVLKELLERAYMLEAGFESEVSFQAFLEGLSDEQRDVLFKLISDSGKHKIKIEKLAKELGIELERKEGKFSFSDRRIFNEIYKLELSTKALYERMASSFQDLLGERVKVLKEMAKEEEMHAKLVEKFVDKTLRIL